MGSLSGSVVLSNGNGERETVLQSESKANLHPSARPTGRFSQAPQAVKSEEPSPVKNNLASGE